MLAIQSVLALLTAHLLPGALFVRWLGIGRSWFDRTVMAAALGGPVAAAVYLLSLGTGLSSLYWLCLAALDVSAVVVLLRARSAPRADSGPSRAVLAVLVLFIVIVETAYLSTTGSLFRLDGDGNLLMDRALQRDTLFHIGMIRSLLVSFPPELLSASGVHVAYHAGYHLQIAAWGRFFGIDVLDGLYRVGAVWSSIVMILSAFLLGQRFSRNEGAGLLSSLLVFGSGLGFLFGSAPGADWWSLIFMDVALVSILLPNPLLPALPLLFVGLACLDEYLESGERKALLGSALGLVPILSIKVFLGAQVLGGIAVAAVRARTRRLRFAALFLCSVSLLLLVPLLASGSGNTDVGFRPLELVRYSMEKLGWAGATRALVDVRDHLVWAGVATIVWVIGFLGLRLVGLPGWLRDVGRTRADVRAPMAWAALVGLVSALMLRVAPAEATGLSRLEAFNDVVWFAAQSGILLWFWTAGAVLSFARKSLHHKLVAAAAVGGLALPCAVQHFFYKASLGVDVVPAELVEAAGNVRELSSPGDVWVEPPNRVRPSLAAYLGGRPVVHDSYVGYDYMFLPREEYLFRRHAVAQFWRTNDRAYASWFLDRYAVRGVLATSDVQLPEAVRYRVGTIFSNRAAELYRVVDAETSIKQRPMATPKRLPLGLAGAPFFGTGWTSPSGSPRVRELRRGKAELYVPRRADATLTLRLELETPHAAGTFSFDDGGQVELDSDRGDIVLVWPSVPEEGLHRLQMEWDGPEPLVVRRIEVTTGAK